MLTFSYFICWFALRHLFFPQQIPKGPKTYLELSWIYVLNEYFDNCEDTKLTQ